MLSDLQNRKFRNLFNVIDVNNDGKIDRADYEHVTKALAEGRGWRAGSPEYAKLEAQQMAVWDQMRSQLPAGSGDSLNLDGWMKMHEALVGDKAIFDMAVESSARFFFSILDGDKDDKISLDDYHTFLRAYGIKAGPWAAEAFRGCDTNKDGFITQDEMLRATHDFYHSNDEAAPGNMFFGPF